MGSAERPGRHLRWACALPLTGACLVVVALVGATSVWAQSATLTLEPDAGPPGMQVTAVAEGFAGCPPDGNDDVGPGEVSFLWDSAEHLATVESGGTVSAAFLVPESASLGGHKVVAQCVGDSSLAAAAAFTVTPPDEVFVVVPNLVGDSVDQAQAELKDAELVLGDVSDSGDVVRDQDPGAGTEVAPGTAVDVVLGTSEPELVVVPDLVDRPVGDVSDVLDAEGLVLGGISGDGDVVVGQSPVAGAEVPTGTPVSVEIGTSAPQSVTVPNLIGRPVGDVPGLLQSSGLSLGQVSGKGDVVRRQNPPAGAQVPGGSAVNVSLTGSVPAPALVAVPNLRNLTAAEARATVAAVGLVLGNDPADAGVVESQAPGAGTLVPRGSAVTVTVSNGVDWPSAGVLIVGAAVVVLAVLAGWASIRAVRTRRSRKWVRAHVRAQPGLGGDPRVEVTDSPGDGSPPTCRIRIEPHADRGTQVVEEVGR